MLQEGIERCQIFEQFNRSRICTVLEWTRVLGIGNIKSKFRQTLACIFVPNRISVLGKVKVRREPFDISPRFLGQTLDEQSVGKSNRIEEQQNFSLGITFPFASSNPIHSSIKSNVLLEYGRQILYNNSS